jgi:hypothetical protein
LEPGGQGCANEGTGYRFQQTREQHVVPAGGAQRHRVGGDPVHEMFQHPPDELSSHQCRCSAEPVQAASRLGLDQIPHRGERILLLHEGQTQAHPPADVHFVNSGLPQDHRCGFVQAASERVASQHPRRVRPDSSVCRLQRQRVHERPWIIGCHRHPDPHESGTGCRLRRTNCRMSTLRRVWTARHPSGVTCAGNSTQRLTERLWQLNEAYPRFRRSRS